MGSLIGRLFASAAVAGALTASAAVAHADAVGFCDFSSNGQLQGLQTNGATQTNGGVVALTSGQPQSETGSSYLKTPIALFSNTTVKVHFRFRMYFNTGDNGGDGIAFSFQNKGVSAGSGGDLGISGLGPSVSVEFDAQKSNNDDPNGNHVGVIVDGKTNQHVGATATPSFNMKNGQVTDVWLDYDPVAKQLKTFIAQAAPKPAVPLLTTNIDLYTATQALQNGNKVFVGFSGSTSQGSSNRQDVTYWVMTNDGTEPTDCIPCVNDSQCVVVPQTPACQPTGFCGECSATNNSRCVGTDNPVCDVSQGRCVECNGDANCGGNKPICVDKVCTACASNQGEAPPTPACPSANLPACQKTLPTIQGACTQCSSERDEVCNTPSRPECVLASGNCGCNLDTDCAKNTICEGNVCVAGCRSTAVQCDTANNFACAIPDGSTIGQCTKGCTTSVDCAGKGVCDLNTNQCVQCTQNSDCPNGQVCDQNKKTCGECIPGVPGPCDPTGAGGACKPNNTCGCNTSADCSGGRVCDPTTKTCTAGCLTTTDCIGGQVCVNTDGGVGQCVTTDAGVDAGPVDSGVDSGDAGSRDSGTGLDSGTRDSGPQPVVDAGNDSGLGDNLSIEGGGCACNVLGVGNGALSFGSAAFAGLAALALARRRRTKG
jgi:Cys-rich repeat protein